MRKLLTLTKNVVCSGPMLLAAGMMVLIGGGLLAGQLVVNQPVLLPGNNQQLDRFAMAEPLPSQTGIQADIDALKSETAELIGSAEQANTLVDAEVLPSEEFTPRPDPFAPITVEERKQVIATELAESAKGAATVAITQTPAAIAGTASNRSS